MAVSLIPCRRRDDHSVTHDIGETYLQYLPEWEPIPPDAAEPDQSKTGESAEPKSAAAPENEPAPSKTGKAARSSADKKE